MESTIPVSVGANQGADTAGSPEVAEAQLQADLEQCHAWASEQLQIHESAATAARSIIAACEAGVKSLQAKDVPTSI